MRSARARKRSPMVEHPYERLALAEDLHLTWQAHLLTVASTRWPPGIFLFDLEYLTVEAKPGRRGVKVAIGSRGAQIAFQVLRFDLDAGAYARLEAFVARMCEHRDLLRTMA